MTNIKKITFSRVVFYIFIAAFLVIQIYPVFWLFIASLKTGAELSTTPFGLPKQITIDNYRNVLQNGNLLVYLKNSLIVTIESLILIVFLSSTAAFAIQKFSFRINKKILGFFTLGIMIPVQVTLIPLFIFYSKMGLLNTHLSLVLPQVGFALPLSIIMFVNFYIFIPNELMEAAIVDGCSPYRIFRSIILPLSSNTVITVVSMYSIFIWNDFIFANTFISETSAKTVALGLRDYVGAFGNVDWGSTFSSICISILIPLVIYFALNKQVMAGMTTGAVKG